MTAVDTVLLLATFPLGHAFAMLAAMAASGLSPLHLGVVLASLAALDSLSPTEGGE